MEENEQKKYSLGANLYKLRIATKEGKGKRGGSRSILAFRKNNVVIWLNLFAKNTKDNISVGELKKLKLLSDILLNLSDSELSKLIDSGDIFEVNDDI